MEGLNQRRIAMRLWINVSIPFRSIFSVDVLVFVAWWGKTESYWDWLIPPFKSFVRFFLCLWSEVGCLTTVVLTTVVSFSLILRREVETKWRFYEWGNDIATECGVLFPTRPLMSYIVLCDPRALTLTVSCFHVCISLSSCLHFCSFVFKPFSQSYCFIYTQHIAVLNDVSSQTSQRWYCRREPLWCYDKGMICMLVSSWHALLKLMSRSSKRWVSFTFFTLIDY